MNNFKKIYFSWQGRICRKTYWIFSIPLALSVFLSSWIIPTSNDNISFIILLIVFYPSMMINIKRAHDRDKTGWFSLVLLIPIISLWPLIEFGFIKGDEADNKYGVPDNIWES
jgi:uncharacterized membrane protein YhaH (DUF805 family)